MPLDVAGRLDEGRGGRDLLVTAASKLNWLKSSCRLGGRPFLDADEELRARVVLSSWSCWDRDPWVPRDRAESSLDDEFFF